MREVNLVLTNDNWFIKQDCPIDLGCIGGEALHIVVDGTQIFPSASDMFDTSYNYTIDIEDDCIPLSIELSGKKLSTIIEAYVFTKGGTKSIQLRAQKNDDAKFSNIVYGFVNPSVTGSAYKRGLPTEFYQFEDKLRNMANNSAMWNAINSATNLTDWFDMNTFNNEQQNLYVWAWDYTNQKFNFTSSPGGGGGVTKEYVDEQDALLQNNINALNNAFNIIYPILTVSNDPESGPIPVGPATVGGVLRDTNLLLNSVNTNLWVAYNHANYAYNTVNNAYNHANNAYFNALEAYSLANSAFIQANNALNAANNAFNIANGINLSNYATVSNVSDMNNEIWDTLRPAYKQSEAAFYQANEAYSLAQQALFESENAWNYVNNINGDYINKAYFNEISNVIESNLHTIYSIAADANYSAHSAWHGDASSILTAGTDIQINGNTISYVGSGGGGDVNKNYVDEQDGYLWEFVNPMSKNVLELQYSAWQGDADQILTSDGSIQIKGNMITAVGGGGGGVSKQYVDDQDNAIIYNLGVVEKDMSQIQYDMKYCWMGNAQDILIAGSGITIVDNTISSSGGGDVNKNYVDQQDASLLQEINYVNYNTQDALYQAGYAQEIAWNVTYCHEHSQFLRETGYPADVNPYYSKEEKLVVQKFEGNLGSTADTSIHVENSLGIMDVKGWIDDNTGRRVYKGYSGPNLWWGASQSASNTQLLEVNAASPAFINSNYNLWVTYLVESGGKEKEKE